MFHWRHKWVEVERFEVPPSNNIPKTNLEGSADTLRLFFRHRERMLYGVTTIIFRCFSCTAIKVVEVLGKSKAPEMVI